jgi:DNA-binding transcriptional LysR family regulator
LCIDQLEIDTAPSGLALGKQVPEATIRCCATSGGIAVDIQDFRIFSRVAVIQNLSQVGAELGLTPGTISKRLQALEDELGVRLFDRTTRSIRITEEGTTFLAHSDRILAEFDSARANVGDSVVRPKGRLKIAVPASLGRSVLAAAICRFMRVYPEVEVTVDLTDRGVNLQEDGYDVAIRVGLLPDSSLIAKRLAADPQSLCASPEYVAAHGEPRHPDDLARHACLVLGDSTQWQFTGDGQDTTVRVGGRLRSNNGDFLLRAALAGEGILQTSLARVEPYFANRQLVRLLPRFEPSANSAIWAVYPSTKHVLPKLRVLLDFLADWFRDNKTEGLAPIGAGRTEPPSLRLASA